MARMPHGDVGVETLPRYKPPSAGRVKASVIVASRSLRRDFHIGHDTRLLSGNGTAPVRRNKDNYTRKDGTVKNSMTDPIAAMYGAHTVIELRA